ncbi:MAG: hypothetical protein ACJ8D7_01810 [Xanthobacteraceae bacterium]
MIGLRYRNVVVAAVAALLAESLSLPALARGTPPQAGSTTKEISNPVVPTMGAVSAPVRNRADASRPRRPNQQVVVSAPMLFLGVGW